MKCWLEILEKENYFWPIIFPSAHPTFHWTKNLSWLIFGYIQIWFRDGWIRFPKFQGRGSILWNQIILKFEKSVGKYCLTSRIIIRRSVTVKVEISKTYYKNNLIMKINIFKVVKSQKLTVSDILKTSGKSVGQLKLDFVFRLLIFFTLNFNTEYVYWNIPNSCVSAICF